MSNCKKYSTLAKRCEKIEIKSDGLYTGEYQAWSYEGDKEFLGFSTTEGSREVAYPVGFIVPNGYLGSNFSFPDNLYSVESQTLEYSHILKNGKKVQVDSAIRDGDGYKISTNYTRYTRVTENPTVASQELPYYTRYETDQILESVASGEYLSPIKAENVEITEED